MTHETLIQIVCGAHVAILGSASTALFMWSSLSNGFRNWRNDVEESLRNSKRNLAVNLGEKLKPILENAATTTTNILSSDGSYCETPVSPTEGESYHNAIFNFINDKAHEMARYRSLWLAHKAYSFWGNYLSFTIVPLMVVEILILALIGYRGILKEQIISDTLILISFTISGIGIVICFFGIIFLLINHSKGINNRGCND